MSLLPSRKKYFEVFGRLTFASLVLCFAWPKASYADSTLNWSTGGELATMDTPYKNCSDWMTSYTNGFNHLYSAISPGAVATLVSVRITRLADNAFLCGGGIFSTADGLMDHDQWSVTVAHGGCDSSQIFDADSAVCRNVRSNPKQKGVTPNPTCNLEPGTKADPIDFTVGNNYQVVTDYQSQSSLPLSFGRTYNSADGLWRGSFSTHLRLNPTKIALVTADGRETYFSLNNNIATPDPDELGTLQLTNGAWVYTSIGNDNYTFDTSNGRLLELDAASGLKTSLTYDSSTVAVADNMGRILQFTQDSFYQPISVTVDGATVNYSYDDQFHLIKVAKTFNGVSTSVQYLYEDTRDSSLLTGIIDERGVRYMSWAYDDQGRAISNERIGGAGKVLISYNTDGTTTVTNELGKQATYHFASINGVNRITSVDGEPAPNCPASNSTYTYNPAGQVLTKTDAKGIITQYAYNPRGLETQRIEGSGSTQPRTTNTEWDPSRFLRTKVAGPTHTTVYTYDAQGRQLTQVTTSNSSQ